MITRILPMLALLALASPVQAQTPLADQVQTLTAEARAAPTYRRHILLDIYRVMGAAKISLSDRQSLEMGEMALTNALHIEAEAALKPLIASGAVGGPDDKQADRNKKLFWVAEQRAEGDRSGGLARAGAEASAKETGHAYVAAGEANLAPGNFITAIDLIGKGLMKGGMAPGEIALAQLHLGIAQYRAGQVDEARRTWSAVRADNGAEQLALAWLAVSRAI